MFRPRVLAPLIALAFALPAPTRAAETPLLVGAARVDITPTTPIHLVGYANRVGEAKEVGGRLHARALAVGPAGGTPVVLVAAEVAGLTAEICDAVAAALRESHGLERAQVAVCVTHNHTGPAIRGLLPFSFQRPLDAAESARAARYTDWLQARLVEVARSALADRRPARLDWTEGRVTFATQRRLIDRGQWVGFGQVPDGPVDHTLPVLRAASPEGQVRAIFTSYACHCTTVGAPNVIHADWAGEAAARLEAAHPGAVALIGIGCGGDAGPVPKGSFEAAAAHGQAVATEVGRVLAGALRPLPPVTRPAFRRVDLPLDRAVCREELQRRSQAAPRLEAHAARELLRELDAGRPPRTAVPCPVQTWCFGDALAMVFLGGEVVSGYSLRLRRELVPGRLWVNAYANDVPCYIPTRSMYSEGGYEVDASILKYGWPTRLGPGTEDLLIAAVHGLLPASFHPSSP